MRRLDLVIVSATLATVLAAGAAGAGKNLPRFGEPVDPKAPRITLAQLLKNPSPYEGKAVVVEGTYAGACGDGDFFFKDRYDLIEALPPNEAMMKACKKGDRIRLYGIVKVHRREESAKESKEEKGNEEASVVILGKGVELVKRAGSRR
jgi:hypothetical protein